jgi:hypothetical protein
MSMEESIEKQLERLAEKEKALKDEGVALRALRKHLKKQQLQQLKVNEYMRPTRIAAANAFQNTLFRLREWVRQASLIHDEYDRLPALLPAERAAVEAAMGRLRERIESYQQLIG